MMTLSAWLRQIGLERYELIFSENDVDLDVLPMLTEQELQDLGISLGHRKKLLRAVAELDGFQSVERSESVAAPIKTARETAPGSAGLAEGERRHITVLFCDLAGSTELSHKLDPEDLREVMRRYQEVAGRVVERYEGHVAQYLGDGMMVYFGWPQAHGGEAERAVHTGLEIIDEVKRLDTLVPLSVRVGIATGLVVVGETGDGDASSPKSAIGETPNIAARLQALAAPNTVVISPVTMSLAGEAFQYADVGEQNLKGVDEPLHVWRVAGLQGDDSESESIGPHDKLRLVGRDEEIGLLRRAWLQSKEKYGQVVLISGEAGIGKSALVQTLAAQLRLEGMPRIFIRCSAHHTSSELYPVIAHVKRVIGWRSDVMVADHLEQLERTLESYGLPLDEFVPPLASLLSVPLPEARYSGPALSSQELKQKTLDCLTEWQLEEAERQPTAMIFEDLHWADPSTLEMLGLLIEQAATTSLLLVLTFRPDFTPPRQHHSNHTPITLNRLERPHVEALVKQLAGGKEVAHEVMQLIIHKTDGVPLYVEEFTKTILTSGILRETTDRFEQTGPLSAVTIPATLHESLMARLDRLPAAREIAQLGAVLGREFAYEMIQALSHVDDSILRGSLSQLVEGELLYQRGRPPRAKYIFKHALIQDAAYQSLLRRVRRQYHKEVAQLIEARFPLQVESEPELLAYHYAGADIPSEAIGYWLKAARRSASRSAYREALGQLGFGRVLLAALQEGQERSQLELQLEVERAFALLATKGMAAAETSEAFSAAHDYCMKLGDDAKEAYARVSWALAASTIIRSEWPRAQEITRELLSKAQRAEDVPSMMGAHRLLGFALFYSGDCQAGRSHLEQAVTLYDYEAHHKLAAVYGQDPGVGSIAILSWILLALGYPDQALAKSREAIELAVRLAHSHSHAYALHYASVIHVERGEYEQARAHAESAIKLSTEFGYPIWLSLSRIIRGEARAALGEFDEGVDEVRLGIDESDATGTRMSRPYNYLALARALRHADRIDEALEAINLALDIVAHDGERRQEADMLRLKGELMLALPSADHVEGKAILRHAIDTARAQGSKNWELRATAVLARALQDEGQFGEAQELLTPVHRWFTEGFDTRDFRVSKAILDEERLSAA